MSAARKIKSVKTVSKRHLKLVQSGHSDKNLSKENNSKENANKDHITDDVYKKTIGNVTTNVIKTVSSLSDCSYSLDKISRESTQLADYSSTIASAGEELSATINSISQNLQNTIQASSQAKTHASQGTSDVDNTLSQINQVNDILKHTSSSLQSLLKTAEQADTIIRVVNDISSKTDLLALNASIEAARAGAAGKGFAVVAHEVGRLSEKTKSSIGEIENIINSIKRSVNEVNSSLEKGMSSAQQSSEQVNRTKNTIVSIVDRINYVDNEVSNIGAAVKEQGQAVSDIAHNVTTISKGSKSVDEQIGTVADLIDQVTRTSNGTRNELGKYDLGPKTLLDHAKIDHMFWMHRLRRMIDGKETIRSEEFTDHTLCRLGKWYYSVDQNQFSEAFKNYYRELESPHAQLHSIAANLIRSYNTGNHQDSLRLYQELIPISKAIVAKIDQMLSV